MYVYKYAKQEKSMQKVVDDIIHNYEEFLRIMAKDGLIPIVYGPVATQKDEWAGHPDFPRRGNEQERNRATEYFNAKLKDMCDNNGYSFVSLFPLLTDGQYYTKGEYIFDQCHLGQNARGLLNKELKKINI